MLVIPKNCIERFKTIVTKCYLKYDRSCIAFQTFFNRRAPLLGPNSLYFFQEAIFVSGNIKDLHARP